MPWRGHQIRFVLQPTERDENVSTHPRPPLFTPEATEKENKGKRTGHS